MTLSIQKSQELSRKWEKLSRRKKEEVFNKLFLELTPSQQKQANSFIQNYRINGLNYAFNYALNALSERTTESARTPATHAGYRGGE